MEFWLVIYIWRPQHLQHHQSKQHYPQHHHPQRHHDLNNEQYKDDVIQLLQFHGNYSASFSTRIISKTNKTGSGKSKLSKQILFQETSTCSIVTVSFQIKRASVGVTSALK